MTKKILSMIALVASVAACTDDYKDWANPQVVPQPEKVSFADGRTAAYSVHTDADTVGEALQSLELIDGDDSEYGLYVTTVCGETLDWNTDHMYWAFYENGEYANAGVDTTNITEGNVYSFVATAG